MWATREQKEETEAPEKRYQDDNFPLPPPATSERDNNAGQAAGQPLECKMQIHGPAPGAVISSACCTLGVLV